MTDITPLDTPTMTGNFESDYTDLCRHYQLSSAEWPKLRRIGYPLPPLPMPIELTKHASDQQIQASIPASVVEIPVQSNLARSDSQSASQPLIGNTSFTNMIAAASSAAEFTVMIHPASSTETVEDKSGLSTVPLEQSLGSSSALPITSIPSIPSVSALISSTAPDDAVEASTNAPDKYFSRYKFQPTVCIESREGDEDEEIYKVEVRGWKMSTKVLEILSLSLTSCSTITNLVLWNCNLNEGHFPSILSAVLTANIKTLALDQNPAIPEHLYALLLSEDSLVKHLSLRMNRITCAGAKAIASTLKLSRIIVSLNFWCNSIGKDGAAELAEALKFNQTLSSLSLAKNMIGDEGVAAFAKVLSNIPLQNEELVARKKAVADLDKLRREQEEDPMIKKAKSRVGNGFGRNFNGKKSEENLSKTTTNLDPKIGPGAKKGGGGMAGGAANVSSAAIAGGKAAVNAKGGAPTAAKKTPEAPAAAAATVKKGAPAATPAAADKAGKDKKAGGAAVAAAAPAAKGAAGKKGAKVEETKEEVEESNELGSLNEPVFENNGQWYVIGNRTLNNINMRQNGITETSLKLLIEVLAEQDLSDEATPEGMLGLFRVAILENNISKDNALYLQLQNLLDARSPFAEQTPLEKEKSAADEENDEKSRDAE
ncbi:Leucine-rich repeat-containing protein 71 [Chytriomyces hyalinus]|nr:Leucine-rich repeat-containing protein 71 [Chytriomyces hyalinus]